MILQRYIFREVAFAFLFTLAIVMAVFLVGMAFQVFRTFSSIGLGTFLRIIPLATAGAASWAILISFPAAVTLVYGRLSADNEIDAMRISGIPTRRIVTPAVVFSLFVCAGSYAVIEGAAPEANYARRMLIREFSVELLKSPPPGKQYFKFDAFALSYIDCSDGVMRMPFLVQWQKGPQTEYAALEGRAFVEEGKPVRIGLRNWFAVKHEDNGRVTLMRAENEYLFEADLEKFKSMEARPDDLHAEKLLEAARDPKNASKAEWLLTTYYARFAQSLTPLFLTFLAVPTGILVRRGSRLAGLGAALPPLLVYIICFFVFQGLGQNGRLGPAAAAFAPDAVLLLLGSGLLWGVCRK